MAVYHGLLIDEVGHIVWECDHPHVGRDVAYACACEEIARRVEPDA